MTTLLHDMPRRGKAFADASAHRVAAANANALLLLEQFDAVISTPEAVDELDRAILQLAVQGKLVAQDPNDEPASELLKRIRDEQDPKGFQKPFGSIRDDEKPFQLPEGWEWTRLSDIAQIMMGQSPPGNSYNETGNGVPLINGPVEFGKDAFAKTKKTKFTTLPTKLCREGDLLICVRGSTTGRTNIAGFDACIGRGVAAIRSYAYQDYVNYFLLHYREEFFRLGTGSTFPSVSADKIETISIPFPPLAEQHRIVARVEQLFAQTRALREKLARSQTELARVNESALAHLLKAETPKEFHAHWSFIAQHFDTLYTEPEHIAPLRQTILELAVRGKLTRREPGDEPASELLKRIREHQDPKGFQKPFGSIRDDEKPFELPEGWEWVRLQDVLTELQTGPFGSSLHKSDYVPNGIPVVNPANMVNGKIVVNSEMLITQMTRERLKRHILRAGDIVMARRGEMGRCVLVTEREEGWLCGTGSLRFRVSNQISREFIILLFQSDLARNNLIKEAVGITMSNLSQSVLENMPFGLPSLAEQRRIVARAEQLMKLCDDLEAKLTAAQDERERLTAALLAEIA